MNPLKNKTKDQLIEEIEVLQKQVREIEVIENERKQAETILKGYKFIVESAHDAIFFKDLESSYVIANAKTLEIFGLPREEVIGKNDYELMPNQEEAEKNVKDDQLIFKTGKPRKLTKHMTGRDGKGYWFQALKVPQFDDKGNIIGLVGFARDITEHKLTELKSRKAEKELKKKMNQLERFNRLTVGRELRMIELKKEVNELLKRARMEKKYLKP